MSGWSPTRRDLFERSARLLPAIQEGSSARPRPPREELLNAFEFEDVAKQALPGEVFSTIAGSDRRAFDRITLRPRMLIPTLDMDLTIEIFGERHYTPILVGPVADQRRYHADGEMGTRRGASAAQAAMILSSRSSVSMREVAAAGKTPLWCSIDVDSTARKSSEEAVAAGCRAICLSFGRDSAARATRASWKTIDEIRQGLTIPMLVKGVALPAEAQAAIDHGAAGVIVSSHLTAGPASIDRLPSIVDAVGSKTVVVVDGSFRRGSDILKGLAFGARAVLIARPVMWGLAGYGADGVQSLIELLQSDLARHIGAMGVSTVAGLNPGLLRVHRR